MSDSTVYLSPEQLCIGLYIQLDLKCWEHDFALSNFKIKDEAQIRALLAPFAATAGGAGVPQPEAQPERSHRAQSKACLNPL